MLMQVNNSSLARRHVGTRLGQGRVGALIMLLGTITMTSAQNIGSNAITPASPGTISTTLPMYSGFEIFKNTGFLPCPINSNTTADSTTKDFFITRDASTQGEFCSYLAGTPIVIPTMPSQLAFFPWYPTVLAQAFTLSLSYTGLFFTIQSLDRSQMKPAQRIPAHFWLQLPLDLVRVIAFLLKMVHGFADSARFAWVNVVLWLLPLNYIFVFSRLRSTEPDLDVEPYVGAAKQIAQLRMQEISQLSPVEKSQPPPLTAATSRFSALTDLLSTKSIHDGKTTRGATEWLCIVATATLWLFSFVVMIVCWKWSFAPGTSFTRTYLEIPAALLDPKTVGNMPITCLQYLQSGVLARSDFMINNIEKLKFSLITSMQLVFSSLVPIALFHGRQEPYDRAYRVLYLSAAATLILLLVPTLAVSIDMIVKRMSRHQAVSIRYTNDLAVTQGCTFAFVNMDKRFGYWDIAYERGFRIAMAFLGAA